MSPRPLRRTALPALAVVATLVLPPSAAVADPPALNRDPCSVLLARAAHFPGGFQDGPRFHRLVSDAYVTHLLSQPACPTTGA